eukprot:363903-Amorphochlora_amoeboformis.AAC.1
MFTQYAQFSSTYINRSPPPLSCFLFPSPLPHTLSILPSNLQKVEVNGPSAVDLYKMLKGEDLPPDGCVDRNSQCRGEEFEYVLGRGGDRERSGWGKGVFGE